MNFSRYLWATMAMAASTARAGNPPVQLPADISVGLAADRSTNLMPGDLVNLTLSVTNLGPEPVDQLALTSSNFVDEFEVQQSVVTDCQNIVLAVGDGVGYYYTIFWFIAGAEIPPLAVGETQTCHLQLVLTSHAPDVYPFSLFLPSFFEDINPDNDSATVILRRAASPIPALSSLALSFLAGAIAVAGGLAMVKRSMMRSVANCRDTISDSASCR